MKIIDAVDLAGRLYMLDLNKSNIQRV